MVRICTPQARGIYRRRALRRDALVLAAFAVVFSVMAALPVARVGAIFGRSGLSFAVVGDSQGRNEVWDKAVDAINGARPQFLLHCGDMVASGTSRQYDDFLARARKLRMPLYTVLGNHDVKGDGRATYARLIRKDAYYSFVQKGYRFIALDSSSGSIDAAQTDWLRRELSTSEPSSSSCTSLFMISGQAATIASRLQAGGRAPPDVQRFAGVGRVQRACARLCPTGDGWRNARHHRRRGRSAVCPS